MTAAALAIGRSAGPSGPARRLACAVVLASVAAAVNVAAAGEYRTVEMESLRITVDSEWVSSAAPGYVPVRWDITNLGDDRTIEIVGSGTRLVMRGSRYQQSSTSVRQRVRLAAGDRVRFTMTVPVGGYNDNVRFQIREGGRTIQSVGYVNPGHMNVLSALIVSAADGSYAKVASGWLRPAISTRWSARPTAPAAVAPGGPPADLVLEPARLPTSWLGYTSVQAVALGPREWELMDAAQRNAVLTWAACGGSLLLVDAGLETLFPDPQRRPAIGAGVAEYFLGRIHVLTSEAIDSAGFAVTMISIEKGVREPAWALPLSPAAAAGGTGGFRLPIPGVDAVPAGAYLTLLALFTVLIGPVNYFVLRRRRQQALIVLTTPLISILFIVLLGGYVAVVEGFSVHGRALSFTVLDEGSGQAATRASASLYAAGRAPSGGLRFPRDVAVIATPVDGAPPAGETLDLSETQQFVSGLLHPRTPTNLETVGFRTARERLRFTRSGGELRVSNGLGATVTRLRYRDANRSYELAEPLPPGGAATLQETAASGRELLGGSDAALAPFDRVVTNLADGSYLAVLERSPFWDGGTQGIDERASFHLLLGHPGARP